MHIPSPSDIAKRAATVLWVPGRRRYVSVGRRRVHVELRGGERMDAERLRAALDRVRDRVEGVDWVAWNAAIGRVIFAFEGEDVDVGALVDAVSDIEESAGVIDEPFSDITHGLADVPGATSRLIAELAMDGLALSASVWGSLARLSPLPIELASVVSFLEAQPRVRTAIAKRIGAPVADLGFAFSNAVAQGLAQGPLSLVNDMALRADLLAQHAVHKRLWVERGPELAPTAAHASAKPCSPGDRPVQLPRAPADVYAERAGWVAAAAGGALTLAGAREIGAGLFVAGLGKAAITGRVAFAAELDRVFARRRVFVIDARVLRRFEQVDVAVIDEQTVDAALVTRAASLAARTGLRVVDSGDADVLTLIRDLQRAGRVVAALSDNDAVLAAADVAIAAQHEEHVAWYADVVAPASELALVLEALAAARVAASRSLALAVTGTGVATLLAFAGARRNARMAANVVNIASLAAIAVGTWDARRLAAVKRDAALHQELPWHALGVTEVLDELGSSIDGLTRKDTRGRPRNRSAVDEPDVVDVMMSELETPLTPVLSGGAAVSALLGSVVDAALVGGVLLGNVTMGVAQRIQTQRAVRRLEADTTAPVTVLRSGTECGVAADEIVPGDIVRLRRGDVVPADSRVVASDHLLVDESRLTGEPYAATKEASPDEASTVVAERRAMVYAGTTIVAGEGDAVVVAVGDNTEAARAFNIGGAPGAHTGVERRLADIARITVPISLAAGGILTANSLLRGRPLRETVATGVGLVAAVLPEGLPIVATTAQLGAARRLSERGAMVRTPRTIEALGRVDVLCFDKTGTLTAGEIEVQSVATRRGVQTGRSFDGDARKVLWMGLHTTDIDDNGNGANGGNGRVHVHSADRALADAAERLGLARERWNVVATVPFEHDRPYAAARIANGGRVAVVVKGAPEHVLPRCVGWQGDPPVALDDAERARARALVDELATSGYRVLAVAIRDGSHREGLEDADVRDLELVGFIGFADAVRASARDAVTAIESAGVEVVMITGDHPRTAEAVARELGVLDGGRVLSGAEMDDLDDTTLDEIVDDVTVYARVTPAHKARIVESLQRCGHVVAMTGDGTNDAGAIRLADVGVALGGRATPAARYAADVVVVDDKLETIVGAVIEGRAMWSSVRDALSILLGGNLGELGYAVTIGLATGRSPLNARQTLLVNLLTDLLPAAAIASRPPRNASPDALLAAGPDRALGSALTQDVITRAIATSAGATGAWLFARGTGRRAHANTVGLVALVETQLGQTLLTGGRSPLVIASTVASTAALVGVIETPFVSQFFGCTPLGPVGWTIAAGAAAAGTVSSLVLPRVVDAVL